MKFCNKCKGVTEVDIRNDQPVVLDRLVNKSFVNGNKVCDCDNAGKIINNSGSVGETLPDGRWEEFLEYVTNNTKSEDYDCVSGAYNWLRNSGTKLGLLIQFIQKEKLWPTEGRSSSWIITENITIEFLEKIIKDVKPKDKEKILEKKHTTVFESCQFSEEDILKAVDKYQDGTYLFQNCSFSKKMHDNIIERAKTKQTERHVRNTLKRVIEIIKKWALKKVGLKK